MGEEARAIERKWVALNPLLVNVACCQFTPTRGDCLG
jgi:hypothetical protein